ncbi:MAG: HAMP domain-containing sensor histidine kinase [Rhodothermales bacterium]|nr:HAMP domain-containing sensor histidine kinase [Rhodothermales bacterium]
MPPSPPPPEPARASSPLLRWTDRFVPSAGGQPDVVVKERVLVVCSSVLAVAALGFGAHAVYLQGRVGGIALTLWAGAALALTYPLLQRKTGSVRLPASLLCFEFAALIALVASFGNGFDGAVLIWMPAVPLVAAFLGGPRHAFAVAAFASAEMGLLFWVDQAGLAPPDAFGPEQAARIRLLALVVGLAFSAFLGWLYESKTVRGLRRVNRELLDAKERAEASERLKSALLMNMSHEVRTPLTGIMGVAEILRDETAGELSELADTIHTNGARLFATLDAVLDLAQIEGGTLEARPEPFDLARCLHEAARAVRPAAARKGLHVDVTGVPSAPARVEADPALARRVLDLLLDNAVKFTERGGVTVGLHVGDGWARVAVEDTGVGIGEDFLPHVFDAFRQESDGMARTYEGTGLGLAVAKRLVALLGGELSVESRRGHGSVFTLRLPLAERERMAPAAAPPRRSEGVGRRRFAGAAG